MAPDRLIRMRRNSSAPRRVQSDNSARNETGLSIFIHFAGTICSLTSTARRGRLTWMGWGEGGY